MIAKTDSLATRSSLRAVLASAAHNRKDRITLGCDIVRLMLDILDAQDATIAAYKAAAKEGKLEELFAKEARLAYIASCEGTRDWANVILANGLGEAVEAYDCLAKECAAHEYHCSALATQLEVMTAAYSELTAQQPKN